MGRRVDRRDDMARASSCTWPARDMRPALQRMVKPRVCSASWPWGVGVQQLAFSCACKPPQPGRMRQSRRLGRAALSWLAEPPVSTSWAEPVQTVPRACSNCTCPPVALATLCASQCAGANATTAGTTPATAPTSAQPHALRGVRGTGFRCREEVATGRECLTGGSASQDSAALPSRLDWRIRPGWGGLHAQLNASCCPPTPLRLQASAGWSGTRLTIIDGESLWPASVLTGLGTPWNTLQPQGQLALQTRGFTMRWSAGRMSLAVQVQLDARAMSSRLSTLRPMGSYRLAVQGGEAPTLTLSTLAGHLQLNGTGQWVGNRLRFAGEASATPEREAALSNLLNIIGRRNGARSIITVG